MVKMHKINLKWGIRVEAYKKAMYLGLGYTWFIEKGVQIDLLFWSVTIGRVYES